MEEPQPPDTLPQCLAHLILEVRWIKRTPKSGRIDRRRCQVERDSIRKVHEGVSARSSEAGDGRRVVMGRSRPAVVFAYIDIGKLGESSKGGEARGGGQEVSAVDRN